MKKQYIFKLKIQYKMFEFLKRQSFLLSSLIILFQFNCEKSYSQSRKYFGQFSHLKSYLNPSMGGYEGSSMRSFYRNQWADFDGAPKTYLISADLDFEEAKGTQNSDLVGKNGFSLNILVDSYGPFKENEIIIGYASRVRISENANLRLGAAANINSHQLDGFNLTTEQSNDPIISPYQGRFSKMNFIDFNLGVALTSTDYFLSYSLNNVSQGKISSGDNFIGTRVPISIFHAGYRSKVANNLSMSTSFLYRSQSNLPRNVEASAKFIYNEKFWVGAGHRFSYANNFQFGLLLSKLRVGYVYELPIGKTYLLPNPSHELMLTLFLFKSDEEKNYSMIW
ncbi:PorP/SprF family type IX secretion system membrane protein [Algoriphagus aquatilis]|uniref:PorP/SprF family type IX secretion system membrane protein n=1 Tax=Algoriphagus aquatilis TaxID=490186 RepID=A0ABW0BVL7_9BACT